MLGALLSGIFAVAGYGVALLTPQWKDWGFQMMLWGSLGASRPLAVALHEAGHAFAAIAIGRRIMGVLLGSDDPIACFRVGSIPITVGRRLNRGAVIALARGPEARWRNAVLISAGAAANVLAAVGALLLAGVLDALGDEIAVSLPAVGAGAFAIVSLLTGIQALWPADVEMAGGRYISDGMRLWRLRKDANVSDSSDVADLNDDYTGYLLVERGNWIGAREHLETALRRNANQINVRTRLLHVINHDRGPEAVIQYYNSNKAAFDFAAYKSRADVAAAWLNISWYAAHLDDEGSLAIADALSTAALNVDQMSASALAVRAVVRSRLGDEEAIKSLIATLPNIQGDQFKSSLCGFIASAVAEQNDQMVQDWRGLQDWFQERASAKSKRLSRTPQIGRLAPSVTAANDPAR